MEFRGRGMFHGIQTTLALLPAEADTGIVFRRTDLPNSPPIRASCDLIAKEPRRTVLAATKDARVETVEHLMSALAGLQVDNCIIEIDAPEVPGFDGSCRPFCDEILTAGKIPLDVNARPVVVDGLHMVQSHNRAQTLVLRPYLYSCLAMTYHLDYGRHAPVPPQTMSAEISPEFFYSDISAARTFVLESESSTLRKMGYGKHLTAQDLVVVGNDGILDNTLRWPDEAVRHKILDCIGDLALAGTTLSGHVTAYRSGHHLNHELARTVSTLSKGQRSGRAAA
ncbi:MAG: UDP-3-O-[3-hydroxymyristoyl] N-acetylglucosamine deacetylase [Fuerstiella sp.]|nr:UDP-3-O-[3-hydroxymyristoyl] N-acetylglucosamine deacetylase [Fuerstiella sp.]